MRRVFFCFCILIWCISPVQSENVRKRSVKVVPKPQTGKRWAICIGINNYEERRLNKLVNAVNDAIGLSEVLANQGDFARVYAFTDVDENGKLRPFNDPRLPTKQKIERFLDTIARNKDISPNDLVVISFSGHGISNSNGEGYLLPLDWSVDRRFESAIAVKKITDWLKELGVTRSLLLLDACREEMESGKAVDKFDRLYDQKFESANVSAVFYATKKGSFSYEDPNSDYGAFTKFVISGLEGYGDKDKDGLVTFRELAEYVENGLTAWALENHFDQRPYIRLLEEQSGDLALTASNQEIMKQGADKQPAGKSKQKLFLDSTELIFGYPSKLKHLEPSLKNILTKHGYLLINDKSEADFCLTLQAEARKGSEIYGLFSAFVDVAISAKNVRTGIEVYTNLLSDIKGIDISFEKASLKALAASALKVNELVVKDAIVFFK